MDSSFQIHIAKSFFDSDTCRDLIAEMKSSPRASAVTYSSDDRGAVDNNVRRVTRVTPSVTSIQNVVDKLMAYRQTIAEYFGVELNDCELPQFLRYQTGDFFVAHQDGNTGMLGLETDRSRRISVSIFLNDQSERPEPEKYCGGSLIFHDWRKGTKHSIDGEAGTLIAFRSELTHEVIPVTHGERYSIVSWYLR